LQEKGSVRDAETLGHVSMWQLTCRDQPGHKCQACADLRPLQALLHVLPAGQQTAVFACGQEHTDQCFGELDLSCTAAMGACEKLRQTLKLRQMWTTWTPAACAPAPHTHTASSSLTASAVPANARVSRSAAPCTSFSLSGLHSTQQCAFAGTQPLHCPAAAVNCPTHCTVNWPDGMLMVLLLLYAAVPAATWSCVDCAETCAGQQGIWVC
jgi:hypothetical protein